MLVLFKDNTGDVGKLNSAKQLLTTMTLLKQPDVVVKLCNVVVTMSVFEIASVY